MTDDTKQQFGRLAAAAGKRLPLQVMRSAAGFYIGTQDEQGMPFGRESAQYRPQRRQAEQALKSGSWLQSAHPWAALSAAICQLTFSIKSASAKIMA